VQKKFNEAVTSCPVFENSDKPAMRQIFSSDVTRTIAARNWTSARQQYN